MIRCSRFTNVTTLEEKFLMQFKIFFAIAMIVGVTLGSAVVSAQVPPVGPSGPTGWCTDAEGRNYRC
jgi:hypothetical protein